MFFTLNIIYNIRNIISYRGYGFTAIRAITVFQIIFNIWVCLYEMNGRRV